MVETSVEASTALKRATKEADAALVQLQHDFALAQKTFQNQMLQEIDASTEKTQSNFKRLVGSLDTMLQAVISKVISTITVIESKTAALTEVCASSGYE